MTISIINTPGALTIRGKNPNEQLTYSVTETPSGAVTGQVDAVVDDCTRTTTTRSAGYANCHIKVANTLDAVNVVLTSTTPAVCSVSTDGHVTATAPGVGVINIKSDRDSLAFTRTFAAPGVTTSVATTGFTAGSLARHMSDSVQAMVNGKTPSPQTMLLYTTNNYTNNQPDNNGHNYGPNNAVRNPNNFAAAYDITGLTVATYYGAGFFPAKLISPRHVICADHVSQIGFVVFKGSDGVTYSANCTHHTQVQRADGSLFDISVWYLDAAMPAAVKPFKVLPADWATKFSFNARFGGLFNGVLPFVTKSRAASDGLRINAGALIRTGDIYPGQPSARTQPTAGYGTDALASFNAGWFSPIINGDSSGPVWAPINGELVLLTSMANPLGGCHYGDCITEIEAAMNAAATAAGDATVYSLGKADLSAFASY